jgi:hypothetical protein
MRNSGEVSNYGRIISAKRSHRRKVLIPKSHSIQKDEGQYSRLMQKRYNVSESTVSLSYRFPVNSVKWQKNSTLGSIVQTAIHGIIYNCSDEEQRERK